MTAGRDRHTVNPGMAMNDPDDTFDEAVIMALKDGGVSTLDLEFKLKISRSAARRVVSRLEAIGAVGPANALGWHASTAAGEDRRGAP